jgi:hypothetical protein
MKKSLFYLFLAISFAQTLNAQVVNIPDASFKSALLLNSKINTNKDNEIQVSEAETYSDSIDVESKKIKNLTGIEAFIKLKKLYCANNLLTTLDISKNIELKYLDCYGNNITTLDISKNIALTYFDCSFNEFIILDISKNIALINLNCYGNMLTNLDVSKNIVLTSLDCYYNQLTNLNINKNIKLTSLHCDNNQLTNLDISKNIALTSLFCYSNQLTNLDVSKNIELAYLGCNNNQLTILNLKNGTNNKLYELNVTNNPLLKCIQVDNPIKIGINWKKDTQAIYSSNCNVSTNDNTATVFQFNLYPNPASQTLHIDWQGDATPIAITLYNSIGAAVKTQQLPQQGSINIADLPRGIYLCRINNANHQSQTTKVVIE